MLTWDEAKAAVQKAQSTSGEDFSRHLADYMVQGVIEKLIEDYVNISLRRATGDEDASLEDSEELVEYVSHEAAIFMTGVQVGWYMGEGAFRRDK